MPISGWLMIGWDQCGTGRPGSWTSSPSTLKNPPLRCRMLPVCRSTSQPDSPSNGTFRTSMYVRLAVSDSHRWNSSSVANRPPGASTDSASRTCTGGRVCRRGTRSC